MMKSLHLLTLPSRLLLVTSFWLCSVSVLCAQADINIEDAVDQWPPSRLQLTPRPAPEPALKYELFPRAIDRTAGNAAAHYGKVKSEQNAFFSSSEMQKLIEQAQTRPLNELRDDEKYSPLLNLGSIYASLRRGARCKTVDWQLPIRDDFFATILLPEVQESRQFIRILCGRARVQVARKDFEGAIETIQTGMALSSHVAQGETVINGLVGVVNAEAMSGVIQEMIAQPEAPNLYWALTSLPSPVIDTRAGFEAERFALVWTEEAWLHPEKMEGDEHFWRRELERLWGYVSRMLDRPNDKAMLTAHVVRGYASAKSRLLARGFSTEEVDSMPVPKVIMLDALHQHFCNNDQQWALIQQALRDPSRLEALTASQTLSFPEVLPLSKVIGLAAPHNVVRVILRLQRRIALLQNVEALRMHAAANGKLPAQLSDVKLVYLAPDPSTGKSFDYELKDGTAAISSTHLEQLLKLELSLAK